MSSESFNRDLLHNATTNMKLFVAVILFVAVAADCLDNTYLPPNSAKTAGGNGNFLSTPFGQTNGAPSTQYGAPNGSSGRLSPPSTSYGIPTKSSSFGIPSNSAFGALSTNFGKSAFGASAGTPAPQYGAPASKYGAPSSYSTASQSAEGRAATLRFNNEHNGDGSYRFEFATENKIEQQETGELKNVGTQQEGSVVHGSYSYLGDDGISYTVNYVADENGFRPSGDHIPTPPPVPAAIQKSLERNAASGGSAGYTSGPQGNYNQGGIGGQQGGFSGGFSGKQGGFGGQQGSFGGNGAGFGAGRPSAGAASRQYLAPNKPSFNQQTGYQY